MMILDSKHFYKIDGEYIRLIHEAVKCFDENKFLDFVFCFAKLREKASTSHYEEIEKEHLAKIDTNQFIWTGKNLDEFAIWLNSLPEKSEVRKIKYEIVGDNKDILKLEYRYGSGFFSEYKVLYLCKNTFIFYDKTEDAIVTNDRGALFQSI